MTSQTNKNNPPRALYTVEYGVGGVSRARRRGRPAAALKTRVELKRGVQENYEGF